MRHWRSCPVCSNKQVIASINDLATTNPQVVTWLASEEDRVKATQITFGSNEVLSWQCKKCPKIFRDKAVSQVMRGSSLCTRCRRSYSYLEVIVEEHLKSSNIDYKHRKLPLRYENKPMELDFWLPSLDLAIEVQDFATHSRDRDDEPTDAYWQKRHVLVKKGPTYHELKRRLTREKLGLTLIDIWEDEIRDGSFKAKLDLFLSTDYKTNSG